MEERERIANRADAFRWDVRGWSVGKGVELCEADIDDAVQSMLLRSLTVQECCDDLGQPIPESWVISRTCLDWRSSQREAAQARAAEKLAGQIHHALKSSTELAWHHAAEGQRWGAKLDRIAVDDELIVVETNRLPSDTVTCWSRV